MMNEPNPAHAESQPSPARKI